MQSLPLTPRLPASASLLALSTLTPPSPILAPCHLSQTLSSGDIPIFFDNPSFDSLVEFDSSSSSSDVEDPSMPRLSQSTSVMTTCTFGLVRKDVRRCLSCSGISCGCSNHYTTCSNSFSMTDSLSNSVSPASKTATSPGMLSHEQYPNHVESALGRASLSSMTTFHSLGSHPSPLSSSTSNNSPFTEDEFYRVSSRVDRSPSSASVQDFPAQVLKYLPPSQTFSTLPTPWSATPSSSAPSDTIGLMSCPSKRRFRLPLQYMSVSQKTLFLKRR